MVCGCWLTQKDCRARKKPYNSKCDHEAVRFFRIPGRPGVFGRCADHVSRDTLRLLKSGDIEEVSSEEALGKEPVGMPDQRSLKEQLDSLERLAIQHGMYDAHDWIRRARSQNQTQPLTDTLVSTSQLLGLQR